MVIVTTPEGGRRLPRRPDEPGDGSRPGKGYARSNVWAQFRQRQTSFSENIRKAAIRTTGAQISNPTTMGITTCVGSTPPPRIRALLHEDPLRVGWFGPYFS